MHLSMVAGFFALSAPAGAFELFGITFFGESAEEQVADVVDPVAYEATIEITGSADVRDGLESSSLLVRQQDLPPSGTVGLVSRANDDRIRLVAALYEAGYFAGVVNINVAGRPLETIALTETLDGGGAPVPVLIGVKTGPLFVFGAITVGGRGGKVDHQAVAQKAGLVTGDIAKSTLVLDAENALVAAWGEVGHPFAKIASRRIIADNQTNSVDVELRVNPGPAAVFGDVTVKGAERIDPGFVADLADIPQGELYDSRMIDRARKNLRRVEALGGTVIRPADRLGPGGRLPIVIEISERKRRVFGAGGTFSSTDGAAVEAYWKHRNLFGEGEVLRVEGGIGRIFEADRLDDFDARALINLYKPGAFSPRTDLDLKAGFTQEDPDPFHREAFFAQGLVTENRTDNLTLRGGLEIDVSWIDDAFGSDQSTLIGSPLSAVYDTRDNPIDATEGVYARLFGEPFVNIDGGGIFAKSTAEIRYYRALDESRRMIIAVRGVAGTIFGEQLIDIPAHRRFYAGGAGSVRGYDFYDVGPRIPGIGATGGRSLIEGSLEGRFRVTDTIGVVPFIDAGFVSSEPTFAGTDEFQAGAGLGLRYFSAVGPIRFDVAAPLNPRPGDPAIAFYLGIGQAF